MMKKILTFGASGKLGEHVLRELKSAGYWVRAVSRNRGNIAHLSEFYDEAVIGDLTKPETLANVCDGIDGIFSSAGASLNIRDLKDRQSYYEVDYQGHMNLLRFAGDAGIKKFVYVSVFGARKQRHLEYSDAHEKFVDELAQFGIDHTVIRPTGFFYVFQEIFNLAKSGVAVQIGNGQSRTNPIHEADLAKVCVEAFKTNEKSIDVGGPEIFTRQETAELAFEALNKKSRVLSVPPIIFQGDAAAIRPFNPRIHALLSFGKEVSLGEIVAPKSGSRRLIEYYKALVNG